MAANPPDKLEVTIEKEGAVRFELRDGLTLRARWNSPKQVQIEMWTDDAIMAPDLGNPFSAAFRTRLVNAAKAHFGEDRVPNIAADLDRVAIALGAPGGDGQTLLEQLEEIAGRSITERLVTYAQEGATFFHNAEREAFARIAAGSHHEVYSVSSRDFSRFVTAARSCVSSRCLLCMARRASACRSLVRPII